jgi:predicted dehydrogenase
MTKIFVDKRPDPKDTSKMLPVENDDIVQFMFTYKNGAFGTIFSNRLAAGRKMALGYEIQLTNGCIVYTQERQNEVQIYRHNDNKRERGFKTVLIAPGHGEYARFYGGAGIGLGYADQKTIEAYHTLKCVAEHKPSEIDFRFGTKVMQVIDAVLESAESHKWVAIS